MKNILEGDFEIQLKTFHGLEELLGNEVRQLGGKEVEVRKRAVSCQGDLGFLYKLNFSSRLATSIIVPVFTFWAMNDDDFFRKAKKLSWDKVLKVNQTFKIETTVHSQTFTHSRFAGLRLKDAMVDFFNERYGKRPDVDVDNPDIIIDLRIDENNITVSLNSSGEPLFKRNYRKTTGQAPLNEVLAAGLLQLAGWDGKGNFLDPMCGSGTLLIEAGMIAMDIPPQIFRKEFAFTKWASYDAELFGKIKETRLNRIKEYHGEIVGYDIDNTCIEHTKTNLESAKMDDIIRVEKRDFFQTKKEMFPLLIVTNPPYGERISIKEDDFYKKIGDTLKNNYPDTLAWFITSDMEAMKKIGLRPSRKIKVFNGKLETRFLQYETYPGTKKIHKLNT